MSNVEKTFEIIQLYDYYKNLLTKKQKQYFELYFFEDLTYQEISENLSISRTAVFDSVSKTLKFLFNLEEKLKLKIKAENMKKNIHKLKDKQISLETFCELIEGEL